MKVERAQARATSSRPPRKPAQATLLWKALTQLVRRVKDLERRPEARDGQDADPELIARLVREEVAAIDKPKDGPPGPPGPEGPAGKDADMEELRALVRREVAAIERPKDGEPGPAGKDADMEELRALIRSEVAAIERPKDGPPGPEGPAGKDADPELIARLVRDEVATIEKPKDGPPGPQGPEGPAGKDANMEELRALVRSEVAAIERPKDGRDGRDGRDGVAGRSIVRSEIVEGQLQLTFTDGTTEMVGSVIGQAGQAGKDADMDALRQFVRDEVAAIKKPKDGPRGPVGPQGPEGPAGKSVTILGAQPAHLRAEDIDQIEEAVIDFGDGNHLTVLIRR